MPMFEAVTAGGEPIVLLLACSLLGLAIGLSVFMIGTSMYATPLPVVQAMSDAHRRARSEQARRGSSRAGFVMSLVAVLVPLVRVLPMRSLRTTLADGYARAGWPGGLKDDEVAALSLLVGAVIAIPLTVLLAAIVPLLAPLGLLTIITGPGLVSLVLSGRAADRQLAIARTMPFAIDLMVLLIRSGASLVIAMDRVAADYADHPVGDEFRATLTEMEHGTTSHRAFENLGARVPVPVVKTFVEDVVLSEELGRPIAESLEQLSDRVRAIRVQDAMETAGKAKVMVLVPGMLILIASLILLFSPFAVRYLYGGYTV